MTSADVAHLGVVVLAGVAIAVGGPGGVHRVRTARARGPPASAQSVVSRPVVVQPEREQWADRVDGVLVDLGGRFERPALVMDVWLVATAAVLRGEQFGEHWPHV